MIRLRALRILGKDSLDQAQLGKKLGLDRGTISRIEGGNMAYAGERARLKLENYFQESFESLMEEYVADFQKAGGDR